MKNNEGAETVQHSNSRFADVAARRELEFRAADEAVVQRVAERSAFLSAATRQRAEREEAIKRAAGPAAEAIGMLIDFLDATGLEEHELVDVLDGALRRAERERGVSAAWSPYRHRLLKLFGAMPTHMLDRLSTFR